MMPIPPDVAKLDEYDAALAWYALQLGLVSEEMEAIVGALVTDAAAVAQWQQASMVAEILIAGREAHEKGLSFEAFKAAVKPKLEQAWGVKVDNNRLEIVFETNVQRAQMAGRMALLNDAVDSHPYWKFSAIVDTQTTPVCTRSHDTLLPASHPWWKAHTPPLHWRCRSTIVPVTERTAKQLGVTRIPTEEKSEEGFGSPEHIWKPDWRTLPRVLVQARKKGDD